MSIPKKGVCYKHDFCKRVLGHEKFQRLLRMAVRKVRTVYPQGEPSVHAIRNAVKLVTPDTLSYSSEVRDALHYCVNDAFKGGRHGNNV